MRMDDGTPTASLKSEQGQDAIEYAGVLAIVAVVVAVILAVMSASGVGATLAHDVGCTVSRIFNGGACGASPNAGGGARSSGASASIPLPGGASGGQNAQAAQSATQAGQSATLAGQSGTTASQAAQSTQASGASSPTTIQRCPTGGESMLVWATQPVPPPGTPRLVPPDPTPPGLHCALSGGGAAGSPQAWSAGSSGLASSPATAFTLNQDVRNGLFPPMPGNWRQMDAAQRNAYLCQAAALFQYVRCSGGHASPNSFLQSDLANAQAAEHASSGPSLGDYLTVLAVAAQQAVPESDALDAADAPEIAGSVTRVLGDGAAASDSVAALDTGEQAAARAAADEAAQNEGAAASGNGDTVFSGHGGIREGDPATTTVPEGTCVRFYCEHGQTISDARGNAIETGQPPVPTESFGPGAQIPNYWLEPPTGLNIQGDPFTVTSPTRLSDLIQENMGVCHWAACRSVVP